VTDDEIIDAIRSKVLNGNGRHQEPATEQMLEEAESLIGSALPPLLRRVYGEVANGGFEPFECLDFMITNNEGWRDAGIPPEDERSWTPGVVMFCEFGCSIFALLDCRTPEGRVRLMDQGDIHKIDIPLTDWFQMWIADHLVATVFAMLKEHSQAELS
jgi:hypothetical protein